MAAYRRQIAHVLLKRTLARVFSKDFPSPLSAGGAILERSRVSSPIIGYPLAPMTEKFDSQHFLASAITPGPNRTAPPLIGSTDLAAAGACPMLPDTEWRRGGSGPHNLMDGPGSIARDDRAVDIDAILAE